LKDVVIYGIRKKHPYNPLQLSKAENQVIEEFKAVQAAYVVHWAEYHINKKGQLSLVSKLVKQEEAKNLIIPKGVFSDFTESGTYDPYN
jgi:hypothetical protein